MRAAIFSGLVGGAKPRDKVAEPAGPVEACVAARKSESPGAGLVARFLPNWRRSLSAPAAAARANRNSVLTEK